MDIFRLFNKNVHTGFIVKDVDAALKTVQQKFLCCESTTPYFFAPDKAWCFGEQLETPPTIKIAMCRIREDIAFEFIEPITPSGFHYLELLTHGDHLNHVAYQTEAYDVCRQAIVEDGAPILFEAETNDRVNGYRRCLYTKIEGFPGLIELQEKATAYRE